MPSLKDNVERWLTHENYSFKKIESSESNFKFLINNGDALGNNIEIFEPGQQAVSYTHLTLPTILLV